MPSNCRLICKSVKHQLTKRGVIVSILSTIPDSYSKKVDIHLRLSMQLYHGIPRSPLLIRYQTSDQHVGK